MNDKDLDKATELRVIIKKTKKALDKLCIIRDRITADRENRNYDDGLYGFHVGEYSDGSGVSADFSRYTGNVDLLHHIIIFVEKQLAQMEAESDRI